jgi:hypothetical protein
MAADFRPVAPVDPTNLRPMLFLDVAREMMLGNDWSHRAVTLERMARESPYTPQDVPLHPAAAVRRAHGFL